MRRLLSLSLAIVACSSTVENDPTLLETCEAAGGCIIDDCSDERSEREQALSEEPPCAASCDTIEECEACHASPEAFPN